jgi:transposase InsO family protein
LGVSNRKAIITAVTVQRLSQGQAARQFGVSKSWVSKVMARYRAQGEQAFEAASRRPHRSPTALPEQVVQAIVDERDRLTAAGLDAGAETISWHLRARGITVARTSIHRTLVRSSKVIADPRKRPRSSYTRFEADLPNECWQSDFTHYPLSTGTDSEIITWLDWGYLPLAGAHSRMALHISAHTRVTGTTVLTTFRTTIAEHGCPASTLTDNGMVYTVRYASRKVRGGRNAFEHELATLGITQKNGRGNHPQTQGKVERFQQTLKKWLKAQPNQPATITDLNTLLNEFQQLYNHHRPHRGIGRRTPAAAYTTRPKATPNEPTTRTHTRIRTDKVNNGKITLRHRGQLFHIGLGRAHNGQPITALVHDLNITIIHTTTGEILRQLTLDTTRRYQPRTTENP